MFHEYVTTALVVKKIPVGEADMSVTLITASLGTITAKAVSARKPTAKLNAHLEPGMLSVVRIIEQHGLRVADAVRQRRVLDDPHELYLLERLLHEADPDEALWQAVSAPIFQWNDVLTALGWAPHEAICEACGAARPTCFVVTEHAYACARCVQRAPISRDAVLYIC